MLIRTFEGVDMNDALKKVKKELGPEAVILSSRKSDQGSKSGVPGVVVTAGLPQIDPPWAQDLPGPPPPTEDGLRLSDMESIRETISRMEREWGAGSSQEIQDLLVRISRLTGTSTAPLSPPFDPVEDSRRILAESGFPPGDCEDLVEAFRLLSYQPLDWSSGQVQSLLQFLISQKIEVTGSLFSDARPTGRPRVILFVGPTGVGKTTTIAKIAAMLIARNRRSVGLINLDTYRIGAIEQLRIYADLMGVPVEVVTSAARIADAIGHLRQNEVILVDSAGRTEGGVEEMGTFFSALGAAGATWDFSTALVVSATQKSKDLEKTVERFAKVRPESVIVTKIDETENLGSLYSMLAHSRLPVSYVGVGQKVPEDIELAHGGRLAQWMIEGWSRDGSGIRS